MIDYKVKNLIDGRDWPTFDMTFVDAEAHRDSIADCEGELAAVEKEYNAETSPGKKAAMTRNQIKPLKAEIQQYKRRLNSAGPPAPIDPLEAINFARAQAQEVLDARKEHKRIFELRLQTLPAHAAILHPRMTTYLVIERVSRIARQIVEGFAVDPAWLDPDTGTYDSEHDLDVIEIYKDLLRYLQHVGVDMVSELLNHRDGVGSNPLARLEEHIAHKATSNILSFCAKLNERLELKYTRGVAAFELMVQEGVHNQEPE